jgi:hypothetical protein
MCLRYLYSSLILCFDFCFVLDFALAAMGLEFFKQVLKIALTCPPLQFIPHLNFT